MTISEDIRATAQGIIDEIDAALWVEGLSAFTSMIAEALMAEREKHAERANKWADDLDGFKDKAARDVMREFARTIRSDKPEAP